MLPMPTVASIYAALGRWALYALIAVGLLLAGYLHGIDTSEKAQAKQLLDQALAYADRIVQLQDQGEQLTAQNNTLRTAQAEKTRIVTREVLRYVQVTPPDRRVVLPGTWRLRHDAAAAGDLAAAAAGPLADGAAGTAQALAEQPVADDIALETVADNYRACRETAAKLEGWQRRQRALAGTAP
ncbi:hypothetical protein [Azonexus sp. R2A61]|uniref:hypothetical protein n=1 Tax=Azonexus sp. R2A61 TaxID=2744443 RepID=UPI001F38C033|nr:hypothetical protein [Azonexus sp. R2A61]